jgi:hypothetical protein
MSETTTEKIDMQAVYDSLTGFDEIAIKAKFGAPVAELDGAMQSRASLYVVSKREGMADADAFRHSMDITNGDLEQRILKPDTEDEAAEGKD